MRVQDTPGAERAMVTAANRCRRSLRLGEEAARAGSLTAAFTAFGQARDAAAEVTALFAPVLTGREGTSS
jgi:hypothetical protein